MGICRTNILGRTVTFEHPDPRFIDEIILKLCYTPNSSFEIKTNDIVIDAGANVGVFTVLAALKASHGKVLAIEPERTNFDFLEDNLKANGLTNVILVNAALSNKTAEAELSLGNPGEGTIMPTSSNRRRQKCSTLSIGNLMKTYQIDHVNFFKIDIEGAEFLLFENPSWLAAVDTVVIEIHQSFGDENKIEQALLNAKYRVSTVPAYDEGCIYLYATR
jgi:FkbM family methyltransferase